tara:strand:+ start:1420 stop:2400 length:981 start_codon:yes stop_codon:yes gene_type:complete
MQIKNISLSIFTIIILLIIIEILLRLSGSEPRKIKDFTLNEPLTNIPDKNLGWIPKIGKHKFNPWSENGKITNLTIEKDGSRKTGNENFNQKIIFIGGSLTQGWAVDDSETFTSIIQNKTNDYKIKNFGVGGYGGFQSLLLLEKIFENNDGIELVIYGYIPHHEVRNIAAGSWMYLLNFFSTRGFIQLPYASIDKKNNLIKKKPVKYINLPLSNKSALIAKLEKRIMKIKSYNRENKKFNISTAIINEMKKISNLNNSKFKFLILENLKENDFNKYSKFLNKNNISLINCPMPTGNKYNVKGEGHPNYLSHDLTADCIFKKIEILN